MAGGAGLEPRREPPRVRRRPGRGGSPERDPRHLGGGRRRLEREARLRLRAPVHRGRRPAWSPDGRSLVFGAFDAARADRRTTSGSWCSTSRAGRPRRSSSARTTSDSEAPLVARRPLARARRLAVLEPHGELVSTRIATTSLDPDPRRSPAHGALAWATYPDWHPTDDLIVYSTRPWADLETGPSNLFTIRPDGTERTQVTRFGADGPRAVQPSWTPDGDGIIFTSVEGTGFGEPRWRRSARRRRPRLGHLVRADVRHPPAAEAGIVTRLGRSARVDCVRANMPRVQP